MSVVINRATRQVIRRANTPDYSSTDWIINPDLSKVDGIPDKYWQIVGDEVLPVDAATRSNIDFLEREDHKNRVFDEIKTGDLLPVLSGLVDVLNTKIPVNKQMTLDELFSAVWGRM